MIIAEIHCALFTTPIGMIWIAYHDTAVVMVERDYTIDQFFKTVAMHFDQIPTHDQSPPAWLVDAVQQEFIQRIDAPDWIFDLDGMTPFEQAVLFKTRQIPRGETRPYSWVAREIGHPGASRAVGTALSKNPIPLIIPCHRVVRAGGDLGFYSGGKGTATKRELLEYEGALPAMQ